MFWNPCAVEFISKKGSLDLSILIGPQSTLAKFLKDFSSTESLLWLESTPSRWALVLLRHLVLIFGRRMVEVGLMKCFGRIHQSRRVGHIGFRNFSVVFRGCYLLTISVPTFFFLAFFIILSIFFLLTWFQSFVTVYSSVKQQFLILLTQFFIWRDLILWKFQILCIWSRIIREVIITEWKWRE